MLNKKNFLDKIAKNISQPNEKGCQLWINKRLNNGHPETIVGGKIYPVAKTLFIIYNGREPKNDRVYKTCKNDLCLTKEHIVEFSNEERIKQLPKKTLLEETIERFHSNYKKTYMQLPNISTECWLWKGHLNNDGYGNISYDGEDYKAHKFSWIYLVNKGKNPPKRKPYILHSCDIRHCVNPEHLRPGSPQENVQDMKERKRQVPGKRAPHSKLNGLAFDIRTEYSNGLEENSHPEQSVRDLANKYGVTKNAIRELLNGNTYKDEGGPIFSNKKQIGFLKPTIKFHLFISRNSNFDKCFTFFLLRTTKTSELSEALNM